MKFPNIQYGRGAPSLGRVGNSSVRAKLATGEALGAVAQEVDRYQERRTKHELAMADASIIEWETKFQRDHDARDTYDADELPTSMRRGDGSVPAFEVRADLYSQEFESNLADIGSKITDRKARDAWLMNKRTIGEQKKAERYVRRETEQRDYYNKETMSVIGRHLDNNGYGLATTLVDELDIPEFERAELRHDIEIRQTDDTINRMIAQGDVDGLKGMRQVLKSKDYDGAYKDEAKLKAVVQEIDRNIESFTEKERLADLSDKATIEANKLFYSGSSHSEQLVKARLISNAELREATVKELKVRHVEEVAKEKRTKEAESTAYWSQLVNNPSMDLLPFAPDAKHRTEALKYIEAMNKGVPIETDQAKYYELTIMAADNPDKFRDVDLNKYRSRLSDTDFQEMAKKQAAVKKEGGAALKGSSTETQELKEFLAGMGLEHRHLSKSNDAGKKARAVAHLVRDELVVAERLKGGELSYEERQSIYDRLSMRFVRETGWFDGVSDVDEDISEIPREELEAITAALRLKGWEVTGENIARVYYGGE